MSEAIWSALIVAVGSIVCQLLINKKGKKEREIADAVNAEKLENRLKNIETKLDIHNGYAEKLGTIEKSIVAIETNIQNLKEVKS